MKLKDVIKESGLERARKVDALEIKIQKKILSFLKNMDDNVIENSKDLSYAIMSLLHEEGLV